MVLKAGLIGYGYWGPVLLRNFTAHAGIEIKTICDHNSSKLKKALTVSPRSKIYQDADHIFSDREIDVVIIATQGGSHYDLVQKALLSGKHVFVEKPFTINAEQAKDLISLNKELNLLIMVDHTFLFTPQYRAIKEIFTDNKLGKVFHFYSIRADFGRFQKDVNILWHLMYHDIYLLLDLFGELKPKKIKASGKAHMISFQEDTAVVSIHYPNGFNADIINNMLFPQKERKLIIAGEKGILLWDDIAPQNEKLKFFNHSAYYDEKKGRVEYSSDNSCKIIEVAANQALENEVDYFVSCLKTNTNPKNDENAALQTIQFLESIQKAMHD